MTRPNIILSSLLYSDDTDPATLFDTTALEAFELDFEDELAALGEPGPLLTALEAEPTSIQSAQITWGNTVNGATLTGSGLNQLNDLATLESQLENGIASGAFDTMRFYTGGQNFLSLNFSVNGVTLTSGAQSVALRGTLPTSFQGIFDLASSVGDVLEQRNLSNAVSVLSAYDLGGLSLIDGGTTLFDLTVDNAGIRINTAGAEFRVDGTLPADSLGALVELLQDVIALEDTAQGFNNLGQIANVAISGISLMGADGTQLVRTTGELDETSPLFETLIVEGTGQGDRNIFLGDTDAYSNTVIAALGAGNDSIEIFARDTFYSDIPLTIDGGDGQDRLLLVDDYSAQVQVDFLDRTILGRQTTDQLHYNYYAGLIGIEEVAVSSIAHAVVLGEENAETAIPVDVHGRFEFYGGGHTDILDLTQVQHTFSSETGMRQSDILDFHVEYEGNNSIAVTHSDLDATIVLGDVEQVRVLGDMGGEVLLTLNHVLDVAGSSVNYAIGTSEADSLKGSMQADVLLGQSGSDFIYGDGIQANLTGPVAGQVFRMYQATLGRAPDSVGYEGWVTGLFEGNLSLDQLARGFVRSTEFQQTYGNRTNSEFIELLYQNVLGRASDAGGLQGWLDAMASGTTREGVVLGFSQSQEFQNNTAQASAEFAMSQSETVWTDEIYRVYRATLDRDPDLGGFQGWAELLGSGTTFDTMVNGFVNSQEFKNTYGDRTNSEFVELLYQNVLDRASDEAGLQGWLDAMASGTTRAGVVRGFSQSSEFQAGTAEDLKSWVQEQGRQDEHGRQVLHGAQDMIISGPGGTSMDVLTGGLLADVFVFEGNQSALATILDFEAWDVLQFNGYDSSDFNEFSEFTVALSQQGNNVLFENQGTRITFNNVQIDDFTADQVEFGIL